MGIPPGEVRRKELRMIAVQNVRPPQAGQTLSCIVVEYLHVNTCFNMLLKEAPQSRKELCSITAEGFDSFAYWVAP